MGEAKMNRRPESPRMPARACLPAGCCLLLSALVACGGGYLLDMVYQPPFAPPALVGQHLVLALRDGRRQPISLTPRATEAFPYFTDRYRLLPGSGSGRAAAGVFELEELFREAFRQRLLELGAALAEEPAAESAPVLSVTILVFQLDLQAHRWVGELELAAEVSGPDRRQATQRVAVSGERWRTYGRGGASELMGSLFTEAVNRIDIVALLQSSQR
jgi:hypothetical protein